MGLDISSIPRGSLAGRLARSLLTLLPKTVVVSVKQGELRGSKWVVGSSIHGCWLGSYEYPKQQLFRAHIKPGSVVFDIGANVGFYTLLSSRLAGPGGRVFAFEPLPRNLGFLRRHVDLNREAGGRCAGNITVIDAAVSDREGTATFMPDEAPERAHIVGTGDQNVDAAAETRAAGAGKAGITVRTVSIDELVSGSAQPVLPPPSLMKIDVEGAEELVLKGAARTIQTHKPTIFLATHGPEVHAACCGTLQEWGYRLTPIGGDRLDQTDEVVAVHPDAPRQPGRGL
jgi:FkbM family methyltransferase